MSRKQKRKIFLFFSIVITNSIFGQRTFTNLIADSKKSQKPILVNINIPQREPALSPIDVIDMSINVCYDGGCIERIPKNFEVENYLTTDDNGKNLISKLNLHNFPITLVFDTNGDLITKCNTFMFGNEDKIKTLLPIFTSKSTADQLKQIELKMYSASVGELKNYMTIKDSLTMTDTDMIDLFVQKATEKDYDKKTQNLLLKFTHFVNSPAEYQILENLNKFSKNYIEEDYKEIQQFNLQEDYRLSLFATLFYAYRTNNDKLFNDKIKEAKNSPIKSDQIDEVIQNVSFLYYKATKRPEELFAIIKPKIDKEILEFIKKPGDKFAKMTLAENLNNAAYTYYEAGGKDENNLLTALSWSKKSINLVFNKPEYLDSYAHLLYVTGDKKGAIMNQKQAFTLVRNLYKSQMSDPQIKEFVGNFELELKKMETGKL